MAFFLIYNIHTLTEKKKPPLPDLKFSFYKYNDSVHHVVSLGVLVPFFLYTVTGLTFATHVIFQHGAMPVDG